MSADTMFVFGVLAAAIALFVSDRIRLDIVAILVVLALALSEILSPAEALSGFGDPVVILIAGLLIVGEGLNRTGVAHAVGNWLMDASGSSETRLLVLMMLAVALLSAFMSSTGAVAIFIPIALSLAQRLGIGPGQLLMPLSLAALIGGMLTLIGTPPNLIVSTELTRRGLEPFGFFEFTPIGLAVLVVSIGFILLVGRRLLPQHRPGATAGKGPPTLAGLAEHYGVAGRLHRLRVARGAAIADKTIAEARLRSRYGVAIVAIERQRQFASSVSPALLSSELRPDDVLYAIATPEGCAEAMAVEGLEDIGLDQRQARDVAQSVGLAEVTLAPTSTLAGRTLEHARFRQRYGISALALRRRGRPAVLDPTATRLRFGDTMRVAGGWPQIDDLATDRDDLLLLTVPAEHAQVFPARVRAPVALAIVVGMLGLITFGVVATVTAVLIAAVAMALTGCVRLQDAYRTMSWQSLILIAGMLPMADALDRTGGLTLIVDGLVSALGDAGPTALLIGLFVVTSLLSQVISNTATTVLLAPVAVGVAEDLAVSPYPLLMGVAIAASTAFATPVASPVNTLVLGPGGYAFGDFAKIGVPLQILVLGIVVVLVPILFPF